MEIKKLIVGMVQTNCYIAINPGIKEAVVVDPGGEADRIRSEVQRLGVKAQAILLTHGQFDHVMAMEELKAAGATFPVKILMSYNPSTANWDKQCQIIEQQMEDVLGADYIDIVLEAGPSTNFLSEVRKAGKYAMMLCNWGPDYADPETYTDPWSLGFTYSWPELATDPAYETGETYTAEDAAALGLEEEFIGAKVKIYNKMVDEAKAEKLDISARYNKFAEAEAYFIDHAFIIPFAVKNDGYCVNLVSPFDRPFAPFGVSSLKYKGAKLLDKPMNLEEYQAAAEQWDKEREAALAAQ